MNGLEYLLVHKPELWEEIRAVVGCIDAEKHKTKVSNEKTMLGKMLYAPKSMNAAMKEAFKVYGWQDRRVLRYVTDDPKLTRAIVTLDPEKQRLSILAAGKIAFSSYNQTDFVKERVMIEVQFGKYAFIAHDLFVKHMAFFTSDHMDVGVEILPMKSLQAQMSTGVPYFEGALYDLIRQGRGIPAVPLVLVGVEPDVPTNPLLLEAEAAEEEAKIEAGQAVADDPDES